MTVFINRVLQTYPPGIYKITRNIPPGTVVRLKLVATDDGTWLPGPGVTIQLNGPVSQGAIWGGGTAPARGGGIRTTREVEFSGTTVLADGTSEPMLFPPGDYELVFQTFQTITTAVTGEWF